MNYVIYQPNTVHIAGGTEEKQGTQVEKKKRWK